MKKAKVIIQEDHCSTGQVFGVWDKYSGLDDRILIYQIASGRRPDNMVPGATTIDFTRHAQKGIEAIKQLEDCPVPLDVKKASIAVLVQSEKVDKIPNFDNLRLLRRALNNQNEILSKWIDEINEKEKTETKHDTGYYYEMLKNCGIRKGMGEVTLAEKVKTCGIHTGMSRSALVEAMREIMR